MDAKLKTPIANLSDEQTEMAVLNTCIFSPDKYHEIEGFLTADDFNNEQHGRIYTAIQEIYQEGNTPEDALLFDRKLTALGIDKPQEATVRIMGYTGFSPHNTVKNAQTIVRLATLRRLVKFAQSSVQLAYSSQNDGIEETFGRVRKWLDAIMPSDSDKALLTWEQSLDAFVKMQLDRLAEVDAEAHGEKIMRIKFPWKAITPRFVRVLRPGMVGIFAADSSVGKTTVMECCADYWAKEGFNVAFFHLELNREFMLERRMVRWSGEPLSVVESGEITEKIGTAQRRVATWRGGIHYVHCPGWSADRIANYMRMLNSKGKCDIAIVDYLQKMRKVIGKGQNEASAYGDMMESLKNASEQLGICTIVGSQMNRASRAEERRTASGIRGSGEPEEKANLVITFDRKILTDDLTFGGQTYHKGDRTPMMDVRVDKNTAGPTGDAKMIMQADRFLVLDVQEERQYDDSVKSPEYQRY